MWVISGVYICHPVKGAFRVSWCPCRMSFECGAPFSGYEEEDNVLLI